MTPTTTATTELESIGTEDTAERQARGEARTEAILDAAVELIAEVGYDRMTMGAIATRARASKATMYRRWPGKAELVAEAFRCNNCADVQCPPDTGSLRGDLLDLLAGLAAYFAGEGGRRLQGLLTAMHQDGTLASIIRAQIDADGEAITATLLARAAARAEIVGPVDGPFLMSVAPQVLLSRIFLLGGPIDEEFQRKLVDEVILPLLTAPAAPGR